MSADLRPGLRLDSAIDRTESASGFNTQVVHQLWSGGLAWLKKAGLTQQSCFMSSTVILFVCLFGWGLTALSVQIGYIAP